MTAPQIAAGQRETDLNVPSAIGQRETTYPDCKADRIPELRQLVEVYKPKQRMRKADKDLVKRILSLMQGYDGDVAKCIIPECQRVEPIDVLELHHYNEVESDNKVQNLGPIHHACNSSLNGRQREATKKLLLDRSRQDMRVSDHTTLAAQQESTSEWTSREGEKHDLMRHRWNAWIHGDTGIFKGVAGARIRITALAKSAVHALGTGSSVTYRRYIEEDFYGGIFDYEHDDGGYKFVVYLGPKKDPSNPK